jgi:UDP-N-acetylglucosamine 2-epimerase
VNIKTITTQLEGRRLEFKETMPTRSDLAKTVVAFANDAGGDIFIGIRNNPREVIGLPEKELVAMEEQISNIIFSRCYPGIQHRAYSIEYRESSIQHPVSFHPLIQFLKPLGFHDYNHLQKNAKAVLSDSGTISEESSIMNFPALNIGVAHERHEAMEEAAVIMVGLNSERIVQRLVLLEGEQRGDWRTLHTVKRLFNDQCER